MYYGEFENRELYGKSTYTETRVKFHLISIAQKLDPRNCDCIRPTNNRVRKRVTIGEVGGNRVGVSELNKLWAIWLLI